MARTPVLQEGLGRTDGGAAGEEPSSAGHPGIDPSDDAHSFTLTCTKCGDDKKSSEFSPSSRHRNGRFPWCKSCKSAYQSDWVSAVPKEERQAQQAAWRAQRDADKEAREKYLRKSVGYALRSRYGVTDHQVAELAAFQKGVCSICGAPPDTTRKRGGLHVDHDHTTGSVRGLLCEPCNLGLGFFKDSPERLTAAIRYLGSPPAQQVQFTEPLPRPSEVRSRRNPEKQTLLKLTCLHCRRAFKRKAQAEFASRSKGKEGPFCTPRCAGLWAQSKQEVKGLVHGTTTGYTSHKCRCPECKKAHSLAQRQWVKGRKSS